MRIVLADDEQKVRSALQLLIHELTNHSSEARRRMCCEITEAAGADAVLRELRLERADLLLLDWELPGMSAGELVERVHALSPGCVIVAMSGRPEAMREAIDLGADSFVSKHEPPDRLIDVVLPWLAPDLV